MKRGVLIVECLALGDPGSEGRLIREVLNLMQVESDYVHVSSIEELLATIADAKYRHVHLSTHGAVTESDAFAGWWTKMNHGSLKRIKSFEGRFTCTAIVSTACKSGSQAFGKYVVNVLGSKYYIAPRGSPYFHNAALFSHIYYHKLFRTQRAVSKAFDSYVARCKNPHRFSLYKRDEP